MKLPDRSAAGLCLCLAALSHPTSVLVAQVEYPVRITPPFQTVVGDVYTAILSPDGSRVVYTADQETKHVIELYSRSLEGGESVKLSPPAPAWGHVLSPTVTPDGARVVYRSHHESHNFFQLYSVPITGGDSIRLNAVMPSNRDVEEFQISPDGGTVYYLADQDTDEIDELYAVPVTGGAVTKLNGPLVPGGEVASFGISPDGTKVVYLADQDTVDVLELYQVPTQGGSPTQLNLPPVAGGQVSGFRISPDGDIVVYSGDVITNDRRELFAVPIEGGSSTSLTPDLILEGDVTQFLINADGSTVVYLADHDIDGVPEVFAVPVEGGGSSRVSDEMTAGGGVIDFAMSPDGTLVVYKADQDTVGEHALYSAPIEGGGSTLLAGGVSSFSYLSPFRFTPDGAQIIYRAPEDGSPTHHLHAVSATGGSPVRLTPDFVTGGEVLSEFAISPDGSFVLYQAEQEIDGVIEAYRVFLAGESSEKLNPTLALGGQVTQTEITPDGSTVVYRAEAEVEGQWEIFRVPIEGGTPARLHPPFPAGTSAYGFAITPNGDAVVYVGSEGHPQPRELYRVPLAGGIPQRLHPPLPVGADVGAFTISPDGTRVVYQADGETDEAKELYTVPITGGTPLKLNAPLVAGGEVTAFVISPDSRSVAYQATQDSTTEHELYSVPINGGETTKLNPTLESFASVGSFEFGPDSELVYFIAKVSGSPSYELYVTPTYGSSATKLSAPLVPGGNVSRFKISPDGHHLVYCADQDTDHLLDLYSVERFAAGSAVKLSTWSSPLGGLPDFDSSFAISPDSSRVVFLADSSALHAGPADLYSVPITGGWATRLNPDPAWYFGDIWDFQFSSGGSHVVYRQREELGYETLHRVPIEGGPSVPVTPGLSRSRTVREYDCVADGPGVVYRTSGSGGWDTSLHFWRPQAWWTGDGGDWSEAANWTRSLMPEAQVPAVLAEPTVVTLTGEATPTTAESLFLGGGDGPTILQLEDGAVLSVPSGTTFAAGAVLRGDGILNSGGGPVVVPPEVEIRAGAGERLSVFSGPVGHSGVIEASGRAFDPAEIHFSGTVTNLPVTGFIAANDATLRFDQGLANGGWLAVGNGLVEIHGDLDNQAGGVIAVSGGATAIFWDDVANASVISVGASSGLQGSAIFFGAFSGNGVAGGGHVFLEGDARPGFSPGSMDFDGDLSLGALARLNCELAPSAHDRITVAGRLELGGVLEVSFIEGFTPAAGMSFDLWDAGAASGQFSSVDLPSLPAGLHWHDDGIQTTGEIRIGLTPESYPEFAALHALGDPAGDPDGDSRCNLLEYLAGTDPRRADPGPGPLSHRRAEDTSELSFVIAEPGGTDLSITLETSDTLNPSSWVPLATRRGDQAWSAAVPVGDVSAGNGRRSITVTDPTPGTTRRFYRLLVECLP
ncbi:hypothetical protein [Haloferula sp. A504]|uniref:hypothetical protein n=1 Tax=Haloferula sp. A504 TaxID=3373601 RepID=UPI0031C77C9D|nr:hypothetical protein [Verrucomicrobiaceae bacterium E54]